MSLHSISFESPLARIKIIATDRGIAKVLLGARQIDAQPCDEETEASPQVLRLLERAQEQIFGYAQGELREFDLPLDITGTAFQLAVWEAARNIPYGRTCSYADLAAELGRPRAARAIGGALHVNPVPIVVPCHRIIGKDGRLVGFGSGLDVKARLLSLEREAVAQSAPDV